MQLIQNGTQGSATVPTKQAAVGTPGYAYGGPPGSTPASRWDPDVANTILAELVALSTDLGDAINPANNAQVLSAVRRYAGANVTFAVTGSTTLTAAQTGIIEVGVSAAATITLPAANALNSRPYHFQFVRYDTSTAVVTLAAAGSNLFYPGGVANMVLAPGGIVRIRSDGTNWMIENGNASGSGWVINGYDPGGFNQRLVSGNYGVGWRTDGGGMYLLITASGDQFGGYSALRPFSVTLNTGALSFDGTGAGANFGGSVGVNGVLKPNSGWLVGVVSNPIASRTNGNQVIADGSAQIYNTGADTPLSVGVGSAIGLVNFYFGSGPVGSIGTNGSVTAYSTTSDATLKMKGERISAAESGRIIDRLAALWFRWKSDPDGEWVPGFFAQQVHRVFPWAVTKGRGRKGRKNYQPWQMDASKLMPVVIAELQALRARVKDLERHSGRA